MNRSVVIASDHAGFALKSDLVPFLHDLGFAVTDLGTVNGDSVDYPDFGARAARAVLDGVAPWGIIICGTGIGISIAANRFRGIRAALCATPDMARLARQHNDANILALAGRFTSAETARAIVLEFANTLFEGGRHAARTAKLDGADMC